MTAGTTTTAAARLDADDHMVKMRITPEIAWKWLEEKNLQNRKVNEAKVRTFAADIRNGHWSLTPQSISFDTHGVLIDGQHRLWAIVEADRPVVMYVGYNFEPDVRIDIDNVQPRSITDHLKIEGKHGDITHQHTACAKAMVRGMRQKMSFTPRAMDEIFCRHGEAIDFAMASLPKGTRRAGLAVAPVRAVIARAWYSVQEAQLREFAHMLVTGIITSYAYTAVALLRNYLQEIASITDAATSVQKYAKTERALQAYLDEQRLSILRPATKEQFPLPEEAKV